MGVVFDDACDYFGVFSWISGKMDEFSKSRKFRGPTLRRKDPTQQRRSMPRRGMSTPLRDQEGGLDKPRVRRGVATVHSMENFCVLFCFAIPLFRGLVYWTNDDPISV